MAGLPWQYNDGGRKESGRRGDAGDCFVRAVAIAFNKPYSEVYKDFNDFAKTWERSKRGKVGFRAATGRGSNARTGVYGDTARAYMEAYSWEWVSCMGIGTGVAPSTYAPVSFLLGAS